MSEHPQLHSILIIDDDPAMLDLLSAILSAQDDLTVHEANSIERAGALPLDVPPDLILLDVVLQDTVGSASLAALWQAPMLCDVPVVFITAMGAPDKQEELLSSGAIGLINKPVEPAKLADQLHELYAAHHAADGEQA